MKKHGILYLIIGIPVAAVLMGATTLYVAFSNPDPGVQMERPALSKTSWQVSGDLDRSQRAPGETDSARQ